MMKEEGDYGGLPTQLCVEDWEKSDKDLGTTVSG